MKKRKLADFNMLKLKIHNNGDVEIWDKKNFMDGSSNEREENKKKSSVTPSPDLQNALDELKPFLAECYDINLADDFLTAEGLSQDKIDAFKIVKPIIRREYKSVLDKITITQLTLSGDPEKRSVLITGKISQPNKSKLALNTSNIRLDQEVFGFEHDLSDVVDKITEEAFLYLTGEKKAQYDMFDGDKPKEEVMEVA